MPLDIEIKKMAFFFLYNTSPTGQISNPSNTPVLFLSIKPPILYPSFCR